MPRPPRKTAADRASEDDLLTDAEKSARLSDTRRTVGFPVVDWEAIDPENVSPALIKRFQNNIAARLWAGKEGKEPLTPDEAVSYIRHNRDKHITAAANARMRADLTKMVRDSAREASKADLESRLARYLALKFDPQPQDEVSLRQLCQIEMRMEQIQDAIDDVPPISEENMKLRQMMTAEYQTLSTNYREFQKLLNIAKSQRDAVKSDKTSADLITEIVEKDARWMEQELTILICAQCKTECAWVWWAFEAVHDPRPWSFEGVCACGARVSAGSATRGKKDNAA